MDGGKRGFRHEEAHEDIRRRQQRYDGPAGGHGFAGPRQDIGDAAGGRCGDMALVEPPLRHGEGGAGCGDRRRLRLDFALAAHRSTGLRECRLQGVDLGPCREVFGLQLVDVLLGDRPVGKQGLAPAQIAGGAGQGGAGIGEIGLGLLDLGGLAGLLEIGALLDRLIEKLRGLVARRPFTGVILVEQWRAGGHESPRATATAVIRPCWVGPILTKSASA